MDELSQGQSIFWYVAPWLPFVPVAVIMFAWSEKLRWKLAEEGRAIESTRGYALGMAGFSFGVLTILIFVDFATKAELGISVYSLLVSFLLFYLASQMQSYKRKVWQDSFSDGALMTANFALMLALAAIVYSTSTQSRWALVGLIAAVWGIDYVARLREGWRLLKDTDKPKEGAAMGDDPATPSGTEGVGSGTRSIDTWECPHCHRLRRLGEKCDCQQPDKAE